MSKEVLRINSQDRSRNSGFNLEKFRFREETERKWFSIRVVDEWNGLSDHVVCAESMESFE